MNLQVFKIITVIALSLSATHAFADWQCYASDKSGHTWASGGSTQERATAVAMSFCSSFSHEGGTCQPTKCTGG